MISGTKLIASVLALSLLSGCGILGGGNGDDKKNTPTLGKRTSILSGESGAEVDPALASISVILPAPVANSEWAQSGGNASKSIGHVALDGSLARAWTANVSGTTKRQRLAAAPVVSGGRLFVIDTEAMVHAFDAATGAKVWTTQIEVKGDGESSRFGGGASVFNNVVYATNGVGDVVALNVADGSEIWKVRPAGPLRGAPTISNGNVYVMTQDNQIYALNMVDGSVQWNEAGTLGLAGIFGVAAPAAGQGTIVAGYSSGELTAYRYENGRNLWNDALARTSITTSVATLSDIDADPVIDRGRVFALGQGGRMAAYELVTGQRIWELNIAGIATPVVAGEWVFVLTDDAKLLCIARPNGKVRWMSQLAAFKNDKKKKNPINWTGPILAGNRLIVASTEGDVVSISPADGASQTLFELDDGVSLPPIVAGGMLYVLDDSGRISAFR
ncbi:PQQ-binding-like beta-propeller repeat protein [Parasphingorhabdus flavimaris]|uniref:PQQ-binding-like beta-propeller repeat protein n=1 Tax=Parasphingorhabdus flavimaris TaxID=266812 RepID=A0ABX2N6V2_9SPHN|nr:PQQ-like beta-propeller repeat protein [Parasphingorhabdus flavimaris]NVD29261.1 PQQ-binding-like beta-propeller repeat protein [Parasphingorhabdus flavimaris]|tara:strand:- start:1918 stop:3252 length:1335 start_codon:yes stop_codon:yes gene_type:complete